MDRKPNTQALSWFLDLDHFGQLNLNPPYQRKSIWSQEYKDFFIDTVLRNFPSPSIFLDRRIVKRRTKYGVIDGKQRLTTVIEFRRDVFPTSTTHSDPAWEGLYCSQLPEEQQNAFMNYQFTVEEILGASPRDLNDAFDRLNRNVAKLNAQELRNARYDGDFIKLMCQLADDAFWKDIGMASTPRVRRMLDVEYVSQVFIMTMHGIQEGTEELDSYYAHYDAGIPDMGSHLEAYMLCKRTIEHLDIFGSGSRYRNLADFYSLWAALLGWLDEGHEPPDAAASAERLLSFAEEVSGEPEPDSRAGQYLLAARQGSNKASNRQLRSERLRELLVEQ